MKISSYNYRLPVSLIAKVPPNIRGESRLLVLSRKSGKIIDRKYADISDYLYSGDVLVLNDTKVIKARIKAKTQSGKIREIVILEKHSFDNDWHRHKILYRRKLSVGDILSVGDVNIIVDTTQGDGVAIIRSDQDLLKIAEKR